MGEMTPAANQNSIETTDLDGLPPTVCDHTRMSDGYTLHTIDPDGDRDIETYDGQPGEIQFTDPNQPRLDFE